MAADGHSPFNQSSSVKSRILRGALKQLLEESGSKLDHIVKMTVYVTDWRHREPVYAAIAAHMKGIHYCSTGVTVTGLNRVQCFVEVDAHAVIPEGDL